MIQQALHIACLNGRHDVIRYLVGGTSAGGAGLDINLRTKTRPDGKPSGQTPLHWACASDSIATVRLLLDLGADIDARDEKGSTPLMQAACSGHIHALAYLLGAGADPTIVDRDGDTCLHWAANKGFGGFPPGAAGMSCCRGSTVCLPMR